LPASDEREPSSNAGMSVTTYGRNALDAPHWSGVGTQKASLRWNGLKAVYPFVMRLNQAPPADSMDYEKEKVERCLLMSLAMRSCLVWPSKPPYLN